MFACAYGLGEHFPLRAQVRAEKRSQYVMVLEDVLDRRRAAARAKDEAWQKVTESARACSYH